MHHNNHLKWRANDAKKKNAAGQEVLTLASGKESLKKVGSHDSRVKKVLAVQRCVTITALLGVEAETAGQSRSIHVSRIKSNKEERLRQRRPDHFWRIGFGPWGLFSGSQTWTGRSFIQEDQSGLSQHCNNITTKINSRCCHSVSNTHTKTHPYFLLFYFQFHEAKLIFWMWLE